MFSNEKVNVTEILAPHQSRSIDRLSGRSRVLVIQDTSYINYTTHPSVTGLGGIGNVNKKKETKLDTLGLVMHTALAVSTEGLSLGILDQQIWARDENKASRNQQVSRQRVPVEKKESYKWLQALMRTVSLLPEGTQAVTICDRESDMYEFIGKAEALNTHYLIRSSWNRSIRVQNKDYYLWDYMESLPRMGTVKIEVEAKRRQKQKLEKNRIAKLEIRFARVELRRNEKKRVNRKECPEFLSSYVVWVKEINPPKGVEGLEWMLLTNVAVESFADAKERIYWYKQRWHIESFHKVLKSGCNIELCRLGTADRLQKYITLFSIIAWRLYWMTYINRISPDRCCTEVLAEHEWKALYCKTKKTKTLPKEPPTIREAIRWIAQLGGFLGRKGDGEPGITTTWRGWQRLLDISEAWLVFNP